MSQYGGMIGAGQAGVQGSHDMVAAAAAAAAADAQRQQAMAQDMGNFTRGLQRDSTEQALYGQLAQGAQQAKAAEAANALNAYTQARQATGAFLNAAMGTRF